jgi:hypothetical protein
MRLDFNKKQADTPEQAELTTALYAAKRAGKNRVASENEIKSNEPQKV